MLGRGRGVEIYNGGFIPGDCFDMTSGYYILSFLAPVQCISSRVLGYLVNLHTLSPQISPRQINLLHELCVCLGDIVECEYAEPEFEEQVGTEGDEGPER
jgi:hypothetical protein